MAASERSSRLPRLDYENLDLLSLAISPEGDQVLIGTADRALIFPLSELRVSEN